MKSLFFYILLFIALFFLGFFVHDVFVQKIISHHHNIDFTKTGVGNAITGKVLFSLILANISFTAFLLFRKKSFFKNIVVISTMLVGGLLFTWFRVIDLNSTLKKAIKANEELSELKLSFEIRDFDLEYYALAGIIIGLVAYLFSTIFNKKKSARPKA